MKKAGLVLLILSLITAITNLFSGTKIPLYPVSELCTDGMKFGYIDRNGKTVIPPGWNRAYHFTDDALAMVEGRYRAVAPIDCEAFMDYGPIFGSGDSRYYYGFIRPDGKYISRKLWGKAYDFRDGMAAVGRDAEMAMGFIDTTGKLVIPEQWQEPGYFSEGLLPVEFDDKNNPKRWQIFNSEGIPVTEPVMLGEPIVSNGMFYFTRDGKTMFYGLDWKFRFAIPYQSTGRFHDDVAVVSHLTGSNYRYGYVNSSGKIILPVKYQRTNDFSDGLGLVQDMNGKYHYIDKNGNFVLKDLDYELAFPFRDGIALVHLNQKEKFRKGFIDKKGRFVIQPKFHSLNEFSGGLAMACQGDRYPNVNCGYIDRSGKYVISPKFTTAYSFNSNRAKVVIKGESGYSFINKNGEIIFKTKNFRIKEFSGGAVRIEHSHSSYSYLDINGNTIAGLKFNSASDYFKEGFGIVMVDRYRSTYMDKTGKYLFPPQRVTCYPFENGHAIVTGLTVNGIRYNTVIIDTSGNVIYKWKLDGMVRHVGDNRYAVYYMPPSQFIYINKKGKQAIPRMFDWASSFLGEHAIVMDRGKYCLIDKKGKIIARYNFKHVFLHKSGMLLFREGEKEGLADLSGKVVIGPRFSNIGEMADGVMSACEKSGYSLKCGYIDLKGEYIFTPGYSQMPMDFSDGLAFFKDNSGSCGYIDKKGDIKISPVFYECEQFKNGLAWVAKKESPYGIIAGYIDHSGNFVWKRKSWLRGFFEGKPAYAFYNNSLDWDNVNYSQLQKAVFIETNRARTLHGLPPFKYSNALERAARKHSEDMAKLGFYSHESRVPGRETVKKRLALAGIKGQWAENISRYQKGRTYGEYARGLVWAWATSPGHRLNIIRKDLKYIGVGIYKKGNEYRATQNFSNAGGP